MSVTRSKISKSNIDCDIRMFADEYFNHEKLRSLGWLSVTVIDVEKSENWLTATSKLISAGYTDYVENDWVVKPIALRNHNLFSLNSTFVDFTAESEFVQHCDRNFNLPSSVVKGGRESRLYGKQFCPSKAVNDASWCYSFSMKDLVICNIPSCVKQTKLDALLQFKSWWTVGHIETGGEESISVTPIGNKLFLISERGNFSIDLERNMRQESDFMNLIKSGPSNRVMQNKVRYYIPQPDYILYQPGLCAHCVLTASEGVSMVFVWEARNLSGHNIPQETLRYYSSGIRHGEYKQLLNTYSVGSALKWSADNDSKRKVNSGLSEHLTAFIQSGEVVKFRQNLTEKRGRKAGLKGASSKRKLSFNLPQQRKWYTAKRVEEKG